MAESGNSEKQPYGFLGELTREEWKQLLHSNEGVFKRCEAPEQTTGIRLDYAHLEKGDTGRGDACKEILYFVFHKATSEQQEFYWALGIVEQPNSNAPASLEYVLTMLGSLERWKEDVRWLVKAKNYLHTEEKILEYDSRQVAYGKKVLSIRVPPVLKTHFPHLFHDVDFTGLSQEETLEKITQVLTSEVEPEEKYLEIYLENLQKTMPFLFED
ncbi:hypothetical protein HYX13_03270 [Candidatus Woesearchaeota archaeon]|nr:hypothetical protein [Candidatus Woesearchaeota archaeon]